MAIRSFFPFSFFRFFFSHVSGTTMMLRYYLIIRREGGVQVDNCTSINDSRHHDDRQSDDLIAMKT